MDRAVKWLAAGLAALLLAVPLLAVLWIAVFGWNWAREPLQHYVTEKTGRQLVIGGDLNVSLGWPAPRLHARAVTFANPAWAKERRMIAVDDVELSVDLLELLKQRLLFPEVRLTHPVVFLEVAADGRKTWLLDREQLDENARIPIGHLILDQGRIGYDDARQNTHVRSEISTRKLPPGAAATDSVVFNAKGLYKGLPLAGQGSGDSVLAVHDKNTPYLLKVDISVGTTHIQADGVVTSLFELSAIDMRLALRGDSLALLYPLFGIALPATHPYATQGRIMRSGKMWTYEKFSGRIGKSDIAGNMRIDRSGARPFMRGDLVSRRLDFNDLGPLVGARERPLAATGRAVAHKLPDRPFNSARWDSVDADVTLRAASIVRAKDLPLENLFTHLKMRDARLSLDPLDFGFAGGHLKAIITLDGGQRPIQARAVVGARNIRLAKLFPGVELAQSSRGQLNGEFDLAGTGDSVGRMLATADGRIALVVAEGKVSKLLMEKIGLHLLEILQLKLAGDKTIELRCVVADFAVKRGIMTSNALIVDTDVSTLIGQGSIDLGQETLDLTLLPKTRATSLVALRGPIYITGSFAKPSVKLDKGQIALRGVGALALGLVNPLLALIPLVEMGPGKESECGRLIHAAQSRLPGSKPNK